MSAFFLSTLVSIVEFAQQDIRTLLQDWLNLVDYLSAETQTSQVNMDLDMVALGKLQVARLRLSPQVQPLSISAISQLLMRRDASLSSCSRDILLKPLLSSGQQMLATKAEVDEWTDLVVDAYFRLKEDSGVRQRYEGE